MAITVVAGGQAKTFYDGRASGSAFGILSKSFEVAFHTPAGEEIAGSFNVLRHSALSSDSMHNVEMTEGDTSALIRVSGSNAPTAQLALSGNDALRGMYVISGDTAYRIETSSAGVSGGGDTLVSITLDRPAESTSGQFGGHTGVVEFTADVGTAVGVGYMTIHDATTHDFIGSVAVSVMPFDDADANASPILLG